MTWRENVVARILLLVARLVADDHALAADIKHLANHISVHAPKVDGA